MSAYLPRLSCIALCTLTLLGAPSLAGATPIATPVPTVDELIGSASLKNSGDDTEMAALRALTGIKSLVLGSKIDVTKNSTATPAPGLFSAWMLSDLSQPGYFALKFGTGSTDASADTFFFKNIGDLTQLVWSNDQVQFLSGGECAANPDKCQIGRLSHYITAPALQTPVLPGGDSNHQVPEPVGIALLGIGAIAAAGARRRRR